MEATGGMTLYVSALVILTEVSSKFISVPSLVHHGVQGKPLVLAVDTHFLMDEAEIQGTWSHTTSSGIRTTLVTFTKESSIIDMMYRDHLFFREPSFSLLILELTQHDEGDYQLNVNIAVHNRTGHIDKEELTVHVTVDVPVSTPVLEKNPSSAVVEDKGNVTLTCSVERGTRVTFQWLKNDIPLDHRDRYHFSKDKSILFISPVRKDDKGTYCCVASNSVSQDQHSNALELNVYYGPYNLEVNSVQGLRTGEVFTINPGELVFFECQADSNPPNNYVWISKSHNKSQVITEGPTLEVRSYRLAQAEEYSCRAFNNETQKQDETQFTLVVASLGTGKEEHNQQGSSVSPPAVIAVCSLFFISCLLLVVFGRLCNPKRVLISIYSSGLSEQNRAHQSGHEDATEDFGIYEFIPVPGRIESVQAPCRSLARLESAPDTQTTIYDVIQHVPEPQHTAR